MHSVCALNNIPDFISNVGEVYDKSSHVTLSQICHHSGKKNTPYIITTSTFEIEGL